MIVRELNIRAFGKFHDRRFAFDRGLHVIYGGNEAGKSTLHAFLRAMLFGMERAHGRAARSDFFSHYEPWFGDGAYGGSLKVEHEGHLYRIERNFSKSPTDLSVTDETTGTPLRDPEAWIKSLLGSLSETAFSNTVSIRQLKSATDGGMVNELKNYIANMNTTGNRALNITKASAYLKDQKKAFERRIVPDAAKNYAANLSEIRKIEEQISSPDFKNRMNELTETHAQTADVQTALQEKKEELLQKLAAEQQSLKEQRFDTRTDVLNYETAVEDMTEDCIFTEQKRKAPAANLLSVLFTLLSIVLALASFLFAGNYPEVYTPLALSLNTIAIGFALLFAMVAIVLFRIILSRKDQAREARETLYASVREHFNNLLNEETEQLPYEELAACIKERTAELYGICDSIESREKTLLEINEKLTRLKERQNETDATIVLQQKSQWLLEQQLEHLTNLKDESVALKNVVEENERIRAEINAINIAQETMSRLAGTIRDSFGLYLNRSASDLIKGITGGRYDSLSIDENLNISLNTSDKLIPLDQVSAGTMDQLYLALRLAAADLMQKDGAQLPFLFDDSFVNYDEDRLRLVLKWLSQAFPKRQILIFSCHRREAQLLSASMLPYTLTELV